MITWNPAVKLIVADVDETIADLYMPAEPKMIVELTRLLEEGVAIFFVTGAGLRSVRERVVDLLPAHLRWRTLVAHCSGMEVWGFERDGSVRAKPFYSLYETALTDVQKQRWRELVQELIAHFGLETHPTMPIQQFINLHGTAPHQVMFEDRGPQLTFEVLNGYNLSPEQATQLNVAWNETFKRYDFRIPIQRTAGEWFKREGLPITARLGGEFAIDLAVEGASKTTAVKHVIEDASVLQTIGLSAHDIASPEAFEVWGDRFSTHEGTDWRMSVALPQAVRSIALRDENAADFPPGYNIVSWTGQQRLHIGLLEYLQSR